MGTYDGHCIFRDTLCILQRSVLLDGEPEDILLSVSRSVGILSNVLSWDDMLDNFEGRIHSLSDSSSILAMFQ